MREALAVAVRWSIESGANRATTDNLAGGSPAEWEQTGGALREMTHVLARKLDSEIEISWTPLNSPVGVRGNPPSEITHPIRRTSGPVCPRSGGVHAGIRFRRDSVPSDVGRRLA
jgi:hypothetical protein